MSRILITGAAGFIGSQLAYNIWKRGEEVTLLDDFSYGKEDNLIFDEIDFRDTIIKMDVCDRKGIRDLFEEKKFDYVYHIAAITPLPDCQTNPAHAVEVNVAGTVNILENARFLGVKNVIFSSTSAVYENNEVFPTKETDEVDPNLIYSSGKYMAELLCRNYVNTYHMNVTVLRFANVYGPHIDCLRTQPPVAGYLIREYFYDRAPILHSTGDQQRDFIYVDDLIDLAIRVMNNTGFDRVNVSSNTTHSINEMDKIIAKIMNKENLVAEHADPDHFWVNYPNLYEGAYPISREVLAAEVLKHTECDNTHAKEKFGWEPKVDFEEGLRRTVDFSVKKLTERDSK